MASKSLYFYRITDYENDGNYRYFLSFQSRLRLEGVRISIILMNSSKAGIINGREKSDGTVGKVLCWCERHNIFQVDILNLFPYREPLPQNLSGMTYTELIGNEQVCNQYMDDSCDLADKIIVAWGDCDGIANELVQIRTNRFWSNSSIEKIYRVGKKTEAGNPRHGRMWNNNPPLKLWFEEDD